MGFLFRHHKNRVGVFGDVADKVADLLDVSLWGRYFCGVIGGVGIGKWCGESDGVCRRDGAKLRDVELGTNALVAYVCESERQ